MGVRARKIALYAKLCGYAAGVFVSPLFCSTEATFLFFQIRWRAAAQSAALSAKILNGSPHPPTLPVARARRQHDSLPDRTLRRIPMARGVWQYPEDVVYPSGGSRCSNTCMILSL